MLERSSGERELEHGRFVLRTEGRFEVVRTLRIKQLPTFCEICRVAGRARQPGEGLHDKVTARTCPGSALHLRQRLTKRRASAGRTRRPVEPDPGA